VSSLIIVPKWRVFRPDDDTRVLGDDSYINTDGTYDRFNIYSLSVHWVADPDDRMTGCLNNLNMIWQT
jgi:hypothetical protein